MEFDVTQPLDDKTFAAALLALGLMSNSPQADSLLKWVASNKQGFASGIKSALNNAERFKNADGSDHTWNSMGCKNLLTKLAPSLNANVYRLEATIPGTGNSTLTVVALFLRNNDKYGLFKDPTFDIDNNNTGYLPPGPGSSLGRGK